MEWQHSQESRYGERLREYHGIGNQYCSIIARMEFFTVGNPHGLFRQLVTFYKFVSDITNIRVGYGIPYHTSNICDI